MRQNRYQVGGRGAELQRLLRQALTVAGDAGDALAAAQIAQTLHHLRANGATGAAPRRP